MLNRVLMQLAKGISMPKSSLASCLGVNEMMLDDMLGSLARMGYIEKIEPGCGYESCRNCYMKAGCNNNKPLMWTISERGLNLLE